MTAAGKPVHLLTLRLGFLCGAPSGAPGDGRGTTVVADADCHACLNAALRALVREMLGVMPSGPVSVGFAASAGRLGVTGDGGRPLAGYEAATAGGDL